MSMGNFLSVFIMMDTGYNNGSLQGHFKKIQKPLNFIKFFPMYWSPTKVKDKIESLILVKIFTQEEKCIYSTAIRKKLSCGWPCIPISPGQTSFSCLPQYEY